MTDNPNELNAQIEQWAADKLFKPSHTADPVDKAGNLVDQSQVPMTRPFIEAVSNFDATNLRMASIADQQSSLQYLERKYVNYVDKRIMKNPTSVFSGPHCRWHFAWFEDWSAKRGGPRLDQTSSDLLLMMLQDGYKPANMRELEPLFVHGEDAVMLAIPRQRHILQALAVKKPPIPPPPLLARHLWDKFGTILKPVIDAEDGTFWHGRRRLYVIDRAVIEQQKVDLRHESNGNLQQSDVSKGIYQEPNPIQGNPAFDVDLDRMFGRR